MALGTGIDNIRHVPTDAEFRMRPGALEEMIREDLDAGRKPFCIVATVGTTSTSSVDPVNAIADIAERYGLWLHIDAAYAGTAAILEEHRHILNGAHRADSLVVNPHKWLFTPVDLSVFYTRRPDVMRRAVSIAATPAYLTAAEGDRAVNLSDYSLALGRRFRSLKLWFVLRSHGRAGIETILRRHVKTAHEIAAEIERDPDFEIAAPVLFSLVCFRYRGSDEENQSLLKRVNASGQALLSSTVLHGRFVLRMAIGNAGTTEEDVRAVWNLIRELSRNSDQRVELLP